MAVTGMTIKRLWRHRFLTLAEEYRTMDPMADKTRFIAVSLALHQAKGHVPKAWWRYAKRETR